MKRLKTKQLGPWCSFCDGKDKRAVYRENHWGGKFCCEAHVAELAAHEQRIQQIESRITSADEQTWLRI